MDNEKKNDALDVRRGETGGVKPAEDYADAGYIPQGEAPALRFSRFDSGQAKEKKTEKKSEKPTRRGIPAGTVIALCLICGLIGGTVGGLAGSQFSRAEARAPELLSAAADVQKTAAGTPARDTEPLPVPLAGETDGAGIGSAIYSMGCPQTVGVTTVLTTQNVFGQTSRRSLSGSGFILSADGYILTNYHVIEAAHRGGYAVSVMLYNGESYPAEIVGYERDGTDLAVLKISAEGLSPVTLGSSEALRVGETVYALGNPLGELAYTMTTGSVSALDREITTRNSYTGQAETLNAFQIDAAVNEGNSGGPLYNAAGEVVGIVTAKYSAAGVEGLGFAIPIDEAANIASELIEKGYVSGKAVLGISGETISANVARYYGMVQGVYVWTVAAGSGAENAGLRPGDIITALDGKTVTGTGDLHILERGYHAGDTCSLTVRRNGEDTSLTVIFDEEKH